METRKQSVIQVIGRHLNNNSTIIECAAELNMTVAQLSNRLYHISRNNKLLRDILESKNWPVNVKKGFIFIGDYQETAGERLNTGRTTFLQPGFYVLAGDKISKGKKTFREIFKADKVKETLFFIGTKDNKKIDEIWLSVTDIERGVLKEFMRKNHAPKCKNTKRTREVYKPGLWLGTPSSLSLVSVNELYLGKTYCNAPIKPKSKNDNS